MVTYGKLTHCNKCGDDTILYADDGVKKGDKWYVVAPCPTCGNMIGATVTVADFPYSIGDTPLDDTPAYEWDWQEYSNPQDGAQHAS